MEVTLLISYESRQSKSSNRSMYRSRLSSKHNFSFYIPFSQCLSTVALLPLSTGSCQHTKCWKWDFYPSHCHRIWIKPQCIAVVWILSFEHGSVKAVAKSIHLAKMEPKSLTCNNLQIPNFSRANVLQFNQIIWGIIIVKIRFFCRTFAEICHWQKKYISKTKYSALDLDQYQFL